ncbi:MAG: aldolase/citrate lyase family protein [Pseudomonadota bacterium]
MGFADFKSRMLAGEILAGTFVKTPAYELIEVLAMSGLDFVCLDGEHAPFDRARLDACLAMARALDFPTLVRVPSGAPENLLQALDSGAVGVVVPHVASVEIAEEVAKAARFGHGGRGYAGSTRWAGYATRPMDAVRAQEAETLVIAQIEEPEAVDDIDRLAAVAGIDGLFLGPADLTVAYGGGAVAAEKLDAALAKVGAAAQAHGKAYMSFVPNAEKAADWRKHGMTVFYVASEHGFMMSAARGAADGIHGLG